jgi:CxxC motif-containing protein (DUF1111 family)
MLPRRTSVLLAHALGFGLAACAPVPSPVEPYDPAEIDAAGTGTVYDVSGNAYNHSMRGMNRDERGDFSVGNNLFGDNWVMAPSSTSARDGLGPVFNALSCGSCHFNDGRGRPPESGEMVSMLVRLSVPGTDAHGGPLGEPTYGGQFQPRSITGVPAEGGTELTWEEVPGTYADGTTYSLRRPVLAFRDLAFGAMDASVLTSMRVAPPVYGLGLLEAISESAILSLSDPDDLDGDGISGRPNYVWDEERGETVLGRFGWKANQPNLRQQTAGAFLGDIGITSSVFPARECGPTQSACLSAIDGGEDGAPELSDQFLDFVVFYGRTLSVPARREADHPEVLEGRALFRTVGCASCHVPEHRTDASEIPVLAEQRIWPYTDLLLHDMGEELADHRPDFEATGTEWRTPPLWGIGLLRAVNRHDLLLHDGRARGVAEAILWHGGEAEAAREAFIAMSASERAALVRFLESL